MRHQSDSVPIRVLVSDDTRVHTELLADALKRDGDLEVTTLLCGSDGLTSGIDFNDSDVLVMSSNLMRSLAAASKSCADSEACIPISERSCCLTPPRAR